MKNFIVGIDGRSTPDPNYWWDRALNIKAKNKKDAVKKYINSSGWLQKCEEKEVEVLGEVEKDYIMASSWARENLN